LAVLIDTDVNAIGTKSFHWQFAKQDARRERIHAMAAGSSQSV